MYTKPRKENKYPKTLVQGQNRKRQPAYKIVSKIDKAKLLTMDHQAVIPVEFIVDDTCH